MDDIAERVNNQVVEWAKHAHKLVVAIDGYTGIGKTTLLNNLAKLNNSILPVSRDDFGWPRAKIESLLRNASDRSTVFELEAIDNKKLESFIAAFRSSDLSYSMKAYNGKSGKVDILKEFNFSKKILVIEGVFLLHPKLLNHLWDKTIYLVGDIAAIDARRIAREKQRWGAEYVSEDQPDSYFRAVTTAIQRYEVEYKHAERADLVIKVA
jgi:uridine kinase